MGKTIILALQAAMLAGTGGCGYLMTVLTPPPPPVKVPAEFAGLANQSVAVIIHAEPGVEYEHPGATIELSYLIASELKRNVQGVRLVDCRQVARYQQENTRWDEMDRTKLGKHFGADYLLYVTLAEYSTREPGSVGLYRGRIAGEASLYACAAAEHQALAWRGADLWAVYPVDNPTGKLAEDERQIRYQTARTFAEKLTRKFYQHKVNP